MPPPSTVRPEVPRRLSELSLTDLAPPRHSNLPSSILPVEERPPPGAGSGSASPGRLSFRTLRSEGPPHHHPTPVPSPRLLNSPNSPFDFTTLPPFDQEDVGERIGEALPGVRTVLVTGGAGFIGCFVARKLVTLYPEYRVVVVDKLDYCGSLRSLSVIKKAPNFTFIKGDITSSDFVSYLLRSMSVNAVIHLAAQTHVDNSFGDSFEFTKNNIMGTHVLLEAAKVHGVARFVHVSTDEVYGEVAPGLPSCKEESILAPSNPYSATKAAAECLVKAYHKSFSLPTIITRSNNVYGPYQYPEKACSKFICQLLRGQKLYIHGNGSNSRRYLYAADVANGIITAFHKGEIGEIYNLGTTFEISNLTLARKLIQHMAEQKGRVAEELEKECLEFVEDRAFNDQRYAVDCAKISKLGWKPLVTFEDGIKKTMTWYEEFGETWWGDISSALVPHPGKKLPADDSSQW